MINEINSQKITIKHDKNANLSKASLNQQAKPPASAQNTAARSAVSLAANAGLPADRLSASIVSFARFFSLPLKPNMLAAIRQQAFMQAVPQPNAITASASRPAMAAAPDLKSASEIMKTRETLSLAALAAESKGVELNPKGLEAYAEAIDPEWQKKKDEDHQRERRNRNHNEKAEKDSLKIESITADSLKRMYSEYTEKNPLLKILNKLPGKNGQRWVVLPFNFFENEKHFLVSIRIMLDEKNTANYAVRMALQLQIRNEKLGMSNESEKFEKRWLFVLESAHPTGAVGNKIGKVVVYLYNDMTVKEQERLKKELAAAMEIPVKSIYVKQSNEHFPCETNNDDQFPLIDEAV